MLSRGICVVRRHATYQSLVMHVASCSRPRQTTWIREAIRGGPVSATTQTRQAVTLSTSRRSFGFAGPWAAGSIVAALLVAWSSRASADDASTADTAAPGATAPTTYLETQSQIAYVRELPVRAAAAVSGTGTRHSWCFVITGFVHNPAT